jgi:hypothetical protein
LTRDLNADVVALEWASPLLPFSLFCQTHRGRSDRWFSPWLVAVGIDDWCIAAWWHPSHCWQQVWQAVSSVGGRLSIPSILKWQLLLLVSSCRTCLLDSCCSSSLLPILSSALLPTMQCTSGPPSFTQVCSHLQHVQGSPIWLS